MQPIIKIKDLAASYDQKQVLTDINLEVCNNDFLGLIGPNGGGKTTLIKCILGLKAYDRGNISYFKNGNAVKNIKMGYLPQYNLIDRKFPISVREVILSGLRRERGLILRHNKQEIQHAQLIIERMGLETLEDRPIGQLSGGQLQRALLGRAIISDPEVLILDEPNTYIDKRFQDKLYDLLEDIQKECAIILVSHDISTVLKKVQKVAYVNQTLKYYPDAQVLSTASVQDIF
jgi:zinc transport system ATP-binding protein